MGKNYKDYEVDHKQRLIIKDKQQQNSNHLLEEERARSCVMLTSMGAARERTADPAKNTWNSVLACNTSVTAAHSSPSPMYLSMRMSVSTCWNTGMAKCYYKRNNWEDFLTDDLYYCTGMYSCEMKSCCTLHLLPFRNL